MKRIAVIGSGISGLGAAWALRDTAHVTLFEKRDRLGGHAHTMTVDYDGSDVDVDVGFIVYNALNYPNLIALFETIGAPTKPSDMSFAVSDPKGYEWASSARGIFAQKRNLLSPTFHRFWRTILKFNDIARAQVEAGTVPDVTLGAWLDQHGFDAVFRDNYILPMGAAIWSTPEHSLLDYPARSFFNFFQNHRLMHKERPKWRTVDGGSKTYVKLMANALGDRVRLGQSIVSVSKFGEKVHIVHKDGHSDVFDEVIMAVHSDQALDLLDGSFESRRFILGSVRYRPNRVFLHRDPNQMPRRRAAWASWNVLKQSNDDICLTYWMNKLQGIDPSKPIFVTLNPDTPPREQLTFASFEFDHPQFDSAAEAAVRSLKRVQGEDGLWLAGAWMGHGFHEDGLTSGLSAALSLGGHVPWTAENVDIVERPVHHADKPLREQAAS